MSEIQKIDYNILTSKGLSMRPETGPMQFGDDWPGIFIRGDDALGYAVMLKKIGMPIGPDKGGMWLMRFANLLASCLVNSKNEAA